MGKGILESMTATVILTVNTTWSAALTSGKPAQWVSSQTQPVPIGKTSRPVCSNSLPRWCPSSECFHVSSSSLRPRSPLVHVLSPPQNLSNNVTQSIQTKSCIQFITEKRILLFRRAGLGKKGWGTVYLLLVFFSLIHFYHHYLSLRHKNANSGFSRRNSGAFHLKFQKCGCCRI